MTAQHQCCSHARVAAQCALDTESLARPGEYSVEVRAEPEVPPVLPGSPLAAGRLLTYMCSIAMA